MAYPGRYRSSGVMLFILNQGGIVYLKDLGNKNAALGEDMQEYNTDSTWHRAEDEHSAREQTRGRSEDGAENVATQ